MRDKLDAPLEFGDEVVTQIPPHPPETGVVIGEMSYSTGEVTCVASQQYFGMPVNTGWVTRTGKTDRELAVRLRVAYQNKVPTAFKPLIGDPPLEITRPHKQVQKSHGRNGAECHGKDVPCMPGKGGKCVACYRDD